MGARRTPHAARRTPHAANAPAKPSGCWQAAARPTQTGGPGCLTSTCQRLPVRSTSAVQGAGRRRPTGGLSCRIHGVCPQHGRRLLSRLDYAPMRSAPPLVARHLDLAAVRRVHVNAEPAHILLHPASASVRAERQVCVRHPDGQRDDAAVGGERRGLRCERRAGVVHQRGGPEAERRR